MFIFIESNEIVTFILFELTSISGGIFNIEKDVVFFCRSFHSHAKARSSFSKMFQTAGGKTF